MPRPPLAFDRFKGKPFDPDARCVAWRVREATGKQGPQPPVFGENGTPLFLPFDSTIEDLRREVDEKAGRYILVQVDANFDDIAEATEAQVEIRAARRPEVAQVESLLLSELKASRDRDAARDKLTLELLDRMGKLATAQNVAPLDAFKAGVRFAEEKGQAAAAMVARVDLPQPAQEAAPEVEVVALPPWVGPLVETVKPVMEAAAPLVVRKFMRWLASDPEAVAAVAKEVAPS